MVYNSINSARQEANIMRILAISGSPRGKQSSTRRLAELVLEGARSAGAETELADLSELHICYCTACGACHVTGNCVIDDEMGPLREKMLAADGLVLGSPLYFEGVTAQLKTVIDRLSGVVHCQEFLGKYACSVATAGGPEQDTAINYMNDILVRLGCAVVGGVGASMSISGSFDAAQKSAVELGRDLVRAFEEKRTYPDQDKVHAAMHERFKHLITANKDNWPHEYDYWQSRGLL
jgi:multimeric flavodoxin WrbA